VLVCVDCSPGSSVYYNNFCCPYSLLLYTTITFAALTLLAAALLSFLSCFPLLFASILLRLALPACQPAQQKSSVSACEDEHPSSMSPSHQALLLEDEKAVRYAFRRVQDTMEDTQPTTARPNRVLLFVCATDKKRESVSATANI
jgi:hypothetical protein